MPALRRTLRVLLCALVVFGLMPGTRGLVDVVAHLIHDGHLPFSAAHEQVAADEDCAAGCEDGCDEDDCDDDRCTPLCHHCACCALPPALAARVDLPSVDRSVAHEVHARVRWDTGPPRFGVKPALFPPIA